MSALFTKVRTYYVLDIVLDLRVIEMSKVWFLPSRCHILMNKTVMHSDKQKSIWKMSPARSILHAVGTEGDRLHSRSEVCTNSKGNRGFLLTEKLGWGGVFLVTCKKPRMAPSQGSPGGEKEQGTGREF